MEELELTEAFVSDLLSYMFAKKYPYNTRRTYGYTIKRLTRDYRILNKESIKSILNKFKHQNQRAVLVLINRYCYENDIDFKINLPRMARQKKKITIKTMPISEIDIMIKAVPKPFDLMLKCIFKIGGGLRISEAIRLSWIHFEWARWLETGGQGIVVIKGSKGDDRIVNVPESLMKELHDYAKELDICNEFGIPIGTMVYPLEYHYGKEGYKSDMKESNLERWKDEYIKHSYNWFRYNILKKYCEPALGHPVKIHSLRHTRATQLYDEKDIPIEIIQKLLGHKEIQTTMVYTEVSNKKVFEAMEGID